MRKFEWNVLYNGDCLDPENGISILPDKSIDIFTDKTASTEQKIWKLEYLIRSACEAVNKEYDKQLQKFDKHLLKSRKKGF